MRNTVPIPGTIEIGTNDYKGNREK